MAYEIPGFVYSAPASGDISAHQFKFVNIDSSGEIALAGAGTQSTGVLQDKPSAQGLPGKVMATGITKVELGGTVAAGADVSSDASGLAVAAATGDIVHGVLLAGGDANEVVPMLLMLNGGQLN